MREVVDHQGPYARPGKGQSHSQAAGNDRGRQAAYQHLLEAHLPLYLGGEYGAVGTEEHGEGVYPQRHEYLRTAVVIGDEWGASINQPGHYHRHCHTYKEHCGEVSVVGLFVLHQGRTQAALDYALGQIYKNVYYRYLAVSLRAQQPGQQYTDYETQAFYGEALHRLIYKRTDNINLLGIKERYYLIIQDDKKYELFILSSDCLDTIDRAYTELRDKIIDKNNNNIKTDLVIDFTNYK